MVHKNKPLWMKNYKGELIDAEKPTYAPDGCVAGSWRKVRSGGKVKFGGTYWQHDKLLPFINQWIWCEVTEYWHVATDCWHNRPGMRSGDIMDDFICKCTNK